MSDKKTFDETIDLLLPHMGEVGSRRVLVESGLYGCRVLSSIDWSGAPQVFTVQFVRTLISAAADNAKWLAHRIFELSFFC